MSNYQFPITNGGGPGRRRRWTVLLSAVAIGAVSMGAAASRQPTSRRVWWAFQPLRAVKAPEVRDRSWAASPLDRFIRSAQEAKGLTPAPEGSPAALLRRLHFDLVGL